MARRFSSFTLTLLLCLVPFISGACTQAANQEEQARMRREIDELKAGQQQILEQLRELKGEPLLKSESPAKLQTPFDEQVDNAGVETRGNKNARLAIIEFSDFQCTYCLSYVLETFPQIDKNYIKTGKVRYFFRNLPLTNGHPNAFRAAEAARCAAEQGKFWEAHDRFFASQDTLNPNDWPQHAKALGLDTEKFDQCLTKGKYDDEINKDLAEAERLGLNGTPAFLIGVMSPDGQKVSVRKVMLGAEPYETFKQALDEALSSKNN
ncbi:MAG TPA: thioredoxin domain-containing protein [Pyrinomonadaceae bacterium]|nr:thioredoxin domain-containing protein [Pyrinomonadaceae bacterium]